MKNPFKLKEKKARTLSEALKTAKKIGYPVEICPVYDYGGRGGMRVVYNEQDIENFMSAINEKYPVLIKKVEDGELWTELGEGIKLDNPDEVINLRVADSDRKGHSWCFGTTRIGKTRLLENIIEQDIRKGYSVVAVDPKGDIDLFSKITQIASDTGRLEDLMLVTPIFPDYSAILDPLSSYYMPEELVGHITAGVAVGKEPFYSNVAYEISIVLVQALLELARGGNRRSFSLLDVKDKISHGDLMKLKNKVDYFDTPEARKISNSLQKILDTTPDYYSKVASSLRVALTELTSGNIGRIIGTANENKFITRLEEGKQVILVVQLGSLLTKKASYTAGKVVISMLESFVGRRYASGKKVTPPLALHIDEAQSVLYQGIEYLFAMAGGANIFIHGYSQSVNQMFAQVGEERSKSILDNCNTKVFMRVPDATTAQYVSDHLGETRVYSPMISLGGGLAIRETEDLRVKPSNVLNLAPRQFYLITYLGTYRGYTKEVSNATLEVIFPDLKTRTDEPEVVEQPDIEKPPEQTFFKLCRVPVCATVLTVLIIAWSRDHHPWRAVRDMDQFIQSNSMGAFGLAVLGGIVAVAGMVLIGWTVWVRWQAKKEKEVEDRDRERLVVSLQEICPVWIKKGGKLAPLGKEEKRGKVQISLDGVAHVWCEPGEVEADVKEKALEPVKLQNERAARFYQKFAEVDIEHRAVIAQLLMLLDREGECASVVSQQAAAGDVETSWDSSTYRKLGKVSLLDHTLNVAELVIAELDKEEAGHMVNDAVIAALGHDIGKLPSKRPKVYSFGDHPLTSAMVLQDLPGSSRLKHRDEIQNAIKLHHKGDLNNLMTKILKEADMKARQAELELVGTQIRKQEAVEDDQPIRSQDEAKTDLTAKEADPVIQQPIASPATIPAAAPSEPSLANSTAAWKAQNDIYGIGGAVKEKSGSQQKAQIPTVDISRWFDADHCLSEIKRHINVLDGNKFQAFSMPTGTVYVQTGLISNILMEQAQKAEVMEITMRKDGNSNAMQPVLLAAADIFRSRNLIETSQVGEGFFGGHFAVRSKDGGKMKGYYAPFTAEAFLSPGESLGKLEQRKKGRLANITSVEIWKE